MELRRPEGLGVDRKGRIWVVDTGNHRLLVVTPDGTPVARYGSLGSSRDRLRAPRDVTFDRAGLAYVADTGNERIQVLRASSGAVEASWSGRTGGRRGHLTQPVGVAYSGRGGGGIWVLNRDGGRQLEFFDLEGTWQARLEVPESVADPVELADVEVEPGLYRMFLADRAGGRVLVLDRRGDLKGVLEAEDGALQPRGVAVTRSLEVYVADGAGRRAVHFSPR
jgi:DNA-binding beta-propeller fold protein YncE